MIRLLLNQNSFTSCLTTLKKSPLSLISNNQIRIRPFASGTANSTSQSAPTGSNSSSTLAKDIIVYKYENPRFFKLMNIFAISQFLFWGELSFHQLEMLSWKSFLLGYLGHWSFTSLRDAKVSEEVKNNDDLSWWRKVNLGESKYKATIASLCVVVGEFCKLILGVQSTKFVLFFSLRRSIRHLDFHSPICEVCHSAEKRQRRFLGDLHTFWKESNPQRAHQMHQRPGVKINSERLPASESEKYIILLHSRHERRVQKYEALRPVNWTESKILRGK